MFSLVKVDENFIRKQNLWGDNHCSDFGSQELMARLPGLFVLFPNGFHHGLRLSLRQADEGGHAFLQGNLEVLAMS